MATNVVVLSQREVSFSNEVLAHQLYEVGNFRLYTRSAQCNPVHVLLCVFDAESDYAWLKEEVKPYLSCPIKIVLTSYGIRMLLGSLLAREIQGLLVTGNLNEEFLAGSLSGIIVRLEEIYRLCFEEFDSRKTGKVTAEDLLKAAEKFQKPKNNKYISTTLQDVSGRDAADNFTQSEFVSWWKSGRKSSGFLGRELSNQILQTSTILHTSGSDFRRMVLGSEPEDVEQSFSGSVTFGEVSESPAVTLNCKLDAQAEDSNVISLAVTLKVQEAIDVSAAKSALESATSALLETIKPYDRHGEFLPHLKFSFSTAHRKVIVKLSLPIDEEILSRPIANFRSSFRPILKCPFTQFVEINVSSDVSFAEVAEDTEQSFLEWLAEGTELQIDAFYWNFYTDLLHLFADPQHCSSVFLTMLASALRDGALELEFSSAEELPSFVLNGLHQTFRRFGSLSLGRLRQLLRKSTHEIVASIKALLTVLASKFDSKIIGVKADVLNFAANGELAAAGLFEAFAV